jgi:Glycosyl hydrolases family 2, sugar binding domain
VENYIWTMEQAVNDAPIHVTFGRLVPWQVIYTPRVMKKLDRDIAEAIRLTANTPQAAHVHVLDLVHQYIRAYLSMEETVATGDFSGGVREADEMLRLRGELGKIKSSLIPVTPEWASKGNGALEWYRKTYENLAERMNGVRGSLVAMTPRRWQFRKDPDQIGTFDQWYLPEAKGGWAELDTTMYWEAQGLQDRRGYGYAGQAWYRTVVSVPAGAKGKSLRLAIGGLYGTEMWLWVNGLLAGHRAHVNARDPFDIDVTTWVHPGEANHIALLVETLPADRNARGGLHRRVFLWSPNQTQHVSSAGTASP